MMTFATRVTSHGADSSPALRAHVLKRAERLQRLPSDIRSCDVVVAAGDQRHGQHFDAHARVLMRGRTIEADNFPAATSRNEDACTAVSNVFNALRRRGDVKVRA